MCCLQAPVLKKSLRDTIKCIINFLHIRINKSKQSKHYCKCQSQSQGAQSICFALHRQMQTNFNLYLQLLVKNAIANANAKKKRTKNVKNILQMKTDFPFLPQCDPTPAYNVHCLKQPVTKIFFLMKSSLIKIYS